jgi:hypothetical protein
MEGEGHDRRPFEITLSSREGDPRRGDSPGLWKEEVKPDAEYGADHEDRLLALRPSRLRPWL